ncbi:MAG TPA: oligosaccharide flippase family protein [Planctomycetota bacterium]|nr:oligosaccharide flippase family protein [Planctomycetota bacterium]
MSDPADTVAPPPAPTAAAPPPADGGPKDSQEVLSKAGFGMGSGLVQVVIRGVTTYLTAHVLHANLLGLFHLSNRIAKVGSLFSLSGQDDAVVHFVAKHRSTGDLGKARGAFNLSFFFATGLSVVSALIVYYLAPWLAREEFKNQPEQLVTTIQWFALAVPLSVLGGVLSAALQGTRQVKKSLATQNVIVPGVRLILFAILALFGLKLFGLVFALLGSFFVGLFYAGWHVKNRVDWMQRSVVPDYSEWRRIALFSLPLILLSLLDWVNNSADIIIVGKFMDESSVGVYGQAMRVFTILKIPVSALSALFVPLCAEFYAKREMERLRTMFRATASCGIRIALLAVGGTILLAQPVMRSFGADFTVGSTALVILSTMLVSNCFAQLGGYAVYMSGRSWLVFLNQLFLSAVCVGISWPLTQHLGIEGAAAARAIGWAAWAGLILVETRFIFGFQPFTRDMAKGVAAAGIAFAACFALQQIPVVHRHMTLVVLTGVVFTALYGGLCVLFGLTEDEKFILRKLGGKLAKKFVGKPKPA